MRIFVSALIFAVAVCGSFVFAEEPPVERWVARYNNGQGADNANAIAIDDSGNVYITGWSYATGGYGSTDYVTIKYDSNGNEKWVARYDGIGNNYDGACAIVLDNTGNVYVTGYSWGSETYSDYATIKYDSNGNEKWVAYYNGSGSYDEARAIALDNSGNVYVTGCSVGSGTRWDYATIKYDSNGNQKWVARYDGTGNFADEACAITIDNFDNIYVTGTSDSNIGYTDYATIKYDSNGNQLWVARYNGDNLYTYNRPMAIVPDNSGNIYITGESWDSNTAYDYATVKYDSNGNQKWVARYDGPGNNYDNPRAIAVDNSGDVYVTGQSDSNSAYTDYATIKYDPNGNQMWVERYNGTENGSDYATSMAMDGSGNIYVTGASWSQSTEFDYTTIKYDPNGNQMWLTKQIDQGNGYDSPCAITLDNTGNVYVTGYSIKTIKYTQHDVCLEKIKGDFNNDCKVDFVDLAILASHWLECKYAYEGDCL